MNKEIIKQADAHRAALEALGYFVILWTPEEVEGVDTGLLEDILIQRGNEFIEDTVEES